MSGIINQTGARSGVVGTTVFTPITPVERPGLDPYGSDNTVLLIHSDHADENANFRDSSRTAHTITLHGGVAHDTAQAKIGGTSIRFDGASTDWLSMSNHADWAFGYGDFTIDFWVRWGASGDIVDNDVFMQYYNTGSVFENHWTLGLSDTSFSFVADAAATRYAGYTFPFTWAAGRWYHIALVRHNANLYGFVNGNIISPTVATAISVTSNFPDEGADLTIGKGHYNDRMFKGWMDEIRITKGHARWTSNFRTYHND